MDQSESGLPIAVDMDGTLILTDMSWVSIKRVVQTMEDSGMLFKEFSGKRAEWKRPMESLVLILVS